MTLHPDDNRSSKDAGSTTGKAPLCHRCHKGIYGFTVTRYAILRDFVDQAGKPNRFHHRRYHPSCSDRIRRRAARLFRN